MMIKLVNNIEFLKHMNVQYNDKGIVEGFKMYNLNEDNMVIMIYNLDEIAAVTVLQENNFGHLIIKYIDVNEKYQYKSIEYINEMIKKFNNYVH